MAVALGLLAVFEPALALTAPLAAIFVVICFRNLAAGLALFTLLTFFEHFGAIGAGSLSAIKGAGLILAFACGLLLLDRRRGIPFLLRDHPRIGWGAIGLVFLGAASVLWAQDPGAVISSAVRLLQVVVLVFVAFTAIRSAGDLRLVLGAFAAGALFAALFGLATGSTDEGTDRLSGGISDPNFLAATLVPALVVATFVALWPGQRALVRILLAPVLVAGLIAVFETQSRGGLIALAVALVAVPLAAGPIRPRVIAVTLVATSLATAYFVLAASTQSRERVADFSAESSSGRTDQWQIALQMTADHPVLGVGLGNYPVEQAAYTAGNLNLVLVEQLLRLRPVVHNTYLEMASELGLGALVLVLMLCLGPLLVGVRALRRTAGRVEPTLELGLRALLPATLALLVAYFFLSGIYEKQLWLLLGVLLAGATLAERAAAPGRLATEAGG